jgi:DNA polymerase-3 subunit delta'
VWDALVGQPDVVERLQEAARAARGAEGAEAARMTHAWLITGPPGSGRSVAARAFAAALVCTDPDEVGCGRCTACTTALAGSHADITVLATEKVTISIDEVRELVTLAQRAPGSSPWRMVIVEDADRMVERTSNLLLKSIEEPPPRTVWLLCAPSPRDVVTTIRSRCRSLQLRIPDPAAVADLLVTRDGADPRIAMESARAAQSHIGLARRLALHDDARARRADLLRVPVELGSVADAAQAAATLVEIAAADATAATEERNATERADLLRALGAEAGGRLPPALRAQVRQLEEDQKRRTTRAQRDVLDGSLLALMSLYRDVLLRQLGSDVPAINASAEDVIDTIAAGSRSETTLRRLDAIRTARERLGLNVPPLLAVEALMVDLWSGVDLARV